MDIKTIKAGLLASGFRGSRGKENNMTITINEHKTTTAGGAKKIGITIRIGYIPEDRVLIHLVNENQLYFETTNIKKNSWKLCKVKTPENTNRYVHVSEDSTCKVLKRFIGTWDVKKEIVGGTTFYRIGG